MGELSDAPAATATQQPPAIRAILFDLDGTLYPTANGYVEHVRGNLFNYMEQKLHIANAKEAWRPLFAKYNQTLRGLQATGHELNVEEYWADTRAGAEQFIKPAPQGLRDLLASLPQDLHIFTNCNEKEAEHILDLLGIREYFKSIYGSTCMGTYCKPEREVFDKVLATLGLEGHQVALFEDSYKNCLTAKSVGMTSVLINSDTAIEEGVTEEMMAHVDAVVLDEHLTREVLEGALPRLWAT
ncbi:HAD-superfamily hydrolase [Tribonema minus]|uniref:HAD-superfamily hydrolase n=1 Tax=Tribonema minus TaxID=303371 RepID=A0A836C9Z4_9STRA|nr:HAD-superfamily hydrolase [Tribonema minus]